MLTRWLILIHIQIRVKSIGFIIRRKYKQTHNKNMKQDHPPRTGPYVKVNAYSKRPALQQILAVLFFLIILILHSIFIVPPIFVVIKNAILIFLLSLNYAFILLIGYDYIYLTCKDPVDPLVNKTVDIDHQLPSEIKKCIICNCNVFLKSYHCMRCKRCTLNFDHHCKYLNNCVGGRNYEQFLRILLVLTVYFLNLIAQAIWVFVETYKSQELQNYMISRWPVLVVMIGIILILLGVESLLIYHFYLTLVRKMTTLEYIFRETPSNESESESGNSSDNHQTQNRLPNNNNL